MAVQKRCAFRTGGGIPRPSRRHALDLSAFVATAALMAPLGAQGQEPTPLPEVTVIAPTPLASPHRAPPKRPRPAPSASPQPAPAQPAVTTAATDSGGIDRDKVPSNTQVLTPADFSHTQSSNVLDALSKNIAGASLSDQSGNPFQRNLDYRGFTASPVPGTPQGLAVYQNGVRINESFGDVVNWDFIPEMAINRPYSCPTIRSTASTPSAVRSSHRNEERLHLPGPRSRSRCSAPMGGVRAPSRPVSRTETSPPISPPTPPTTTAGATSPRRRNCAGCMSTSAPATTRPSSTSIHRRGQLRSARSRRPRSSFSIRNGRASTPGRRPRICSSRFSPRASATARPTRCSFQGNAYYRGFWQAHVDGNGTDAQPCDPGGLLPGQLCIGDGMTAINQNYAGAGHCCRPTPSWARSIATRPRPKLRRLGAGRPAPAKVLGHDNHFAAGISVDHGHSQFSGDQRARHHRPESVRDRDRSVHRSAGRRHHPGQPARHQHLYGHLRDRHPRPRPRKLSLTTGARFNIAADRSDRRDRRQSAAQQQQHLPTPQPGGRADLQVHARPYRLCRLFGSQPRADSARARLLRSRCIPA